jgi:hypothetical protein
MTQVTINGNTYSDGVSTTGVNGLAQGGHRTYFIPLVSDVVTVAGQVSSNAAAVAADQATVAADKATVQSTASGVSLTTTSTSSVLIGSGTKTFTLAAAINIAIGQFAIASDQSNVANYVYGPVTAWNAGTKVLSIDSQVQGGSGTISSWNVSVSGARGAQGPTGGGTGDMLAAQNLNDLANKTTARANLGVAIGTDVQAYNANTVFANVSNTFTSAQIFSDQDVRRAVFEDCAEEAVNVGGTLSGSLTLDYVNGHYQYGTMTGNITSVTINNWPPSGKHGWMYLELNQDASGGRTLTLGSAFKTQNGAGISITTTPNARNRLIFTSRDAGTTILTDLGADYK